MRHCFLYLLIVFFSWLFFRGHFLAVNTTININITMSTRSLAIIVPWSQNDTPFKRQNLELRRFFAWWFGISNWFGVTASLLRSAHVFDLRLNNGKRRGWFNYPTIKPLNSLFYHSSQLLNCNIIFDWESLWLTKWYTSKKLPIRVVKQKF